MKKQKSTCIIITFTSFELVSRTTMVITNINSKTNFIVEDWQVDGKGIV